MPCVASTTSSAPSHEAMARENLVGKVDVSRGVDQIERVAFAVVGCVLHLNGVALDRDALFAFQFHVIEHLCLHLALIERVGFFQQAVGKGRFAVVDMGYDAEIADVFHRDRIKSSAKIRIFY